MSALLSSLCCCFSQQDDYHQDDERTALLNPDIIPQAPARPVGRSTEEQLAEQQALRRILHDASERFVNIISPSPFTRPSISSRSASPTSSRSRSPSPTPSSFDSASSIPIDSPRTRQSNHQHQQRSLSAQVERSRKISNVSTATWRAPGEQEVKVVHLGTNFEPHERRRGGEREGARERERERERPMSSHSLKTLPRGGAPGRGMPSPLGKGKKGQRESAEEEEDDEEEEEEDSRFATMASYRTAHEGEGSEELAAGGGGGTIGRNGSGKKAAGGAKQALSEIWGREGEGEVEAEEQSEEQSKELTQALKSLEDSMSTFTLTPVGPIVADLGDISA